MLYTSTTSFSSKEMQGVSFTIHRMSFARRIDLAQRIREEGRKLAFLESGQGAGDKIDALVLGQEIEKLYFEWGLKEIQGLEIDGEPATPQLLIERGPEGLCREIVEVIKSECGLSEEERKN